MASYDVARGFYESLVNGLLTVDCRKRMGCGRTGMREVKVHPWFDGLDWGRLLERKIHPPITPKISHPLDTQHFDEYDEDGSDTEEYELPLEALDQLFSDF
jgi:hypothetical protein